MVESTKPDFEVTEDIFDGMEIEKPEWFLHDSDYKLSEDERTALFEDAYFRTYGRFANDGRQYAYENAIAEIHNTPKLQ